MFFDDALRTSPISKIIARVGVVCLIRKSCSSSCILTDGILLQQRSWVQCIAHWPPARSINGGTIPWSLWWSKLIINQVKGEYEVRHEDMIPYHHAAIKLVDSFDGLYISHVSHLLNTKVDILAALMVTLALPADTTYCLTSGYSSTLLSEVRFRG